MNYELQVVTVPVSDVDHAPTLYTDQADFTVLTLPNTSDTRREALFASTLEPSDAPTPDMIARAINSAIQRFGTRGCTGRVAQEFGDHPDLAARRMRWARQLAGRAGYQTTDIGTCGPSMDTPRRGQASSAGRGRRRLRPWNRFQSHWRIRRLLAQMTITGMRSPAPPIRAIASSGRCVTCAPTPRAARHGRPAAAEPGKTRRMSTRRSSGAGGRGGHEAAGSATAC
jgi:hypothetical protein